MNLSTLKHYSNGKRLPNWFWLVVFGAGIGFQSGVLYMTTIMSTERVMQAVRENSAADSSRAAMMTEHLQGVKDTLDRRTNRINEELSHLQAVTNYVARKVE